MRWLRLPPARGRLLRLASKIRSRRRGPVWVRFAWAARWHRHLFALHCRIQQRLHPVGLRETRLTTTCEQSSTYTFNYNDTFTNKTHWAAARIIVDLVCEDLCMTALHSLYLLLTACLFHGIGTIILIPVRRSAFLLVPLGAGFDFWIPVWRLEDTLLCSVRGMERLILLRGWIVDIITLSLADRFLLAFSASEFFPFFAGTRKRVSGSMQARVIDEICCCLSQLFCSKSCLETTSSLSPASLRWQARKGGNTRMISRKHHLRFKARRGKH